MTRDKMIDRIQKLLAHAESAKKLGNEEEAQAFAAKVNELLLTHKLSMSAIEIAAQDTDDVMGEEIVRMGGRKRSQWKEDLASTVARAHFCRILIVTGSDTIWFVGRESDRALAIWVYKYLIEQIDKLGKRGLRRERRAVGNEMAKGFMASYVRGFVHQVSSRYYEERRKADAAAKRMSNSTALVRAAGAVEKYMGDAFGSSRPAAHLNGQRGHHEGGYESGQRDGSTANIRGDRAVGDSGGSSRQIGGF